MTEVNPAGDLSWFLATSNRTGHEIYIRARLWYEARQLAETDLTQRFGADACSEGVHVEEMAPGFEPPKYETSVGALMGSRDGDRP